MLAITRWRSVAHSGRGGLRVRLTLVELAAELAEPRRYARAKLSVDGKDPAKWVKPADLDVFVLATFKGNRRKIATLEAASGVGLDVEGTTFGFDDALAVVRELGLRAIVVTTLNHRPERPRLRILVPYARAVRREDEHRRCWRYLAERIAAVGGAVDEATCDVSRAWFASAAVEDAEFRCELVDGAPLDVELALAAMPEEATVPHRGTAIGAQTRRSGVHRGPTKPDGTPNRSNQAASSALRAARRARTTGEDIDAARAAWRDTLLDAANASPAAEWLRAKYAQSSAEGDRHVDRAWRFAVAQVDAHPLRQTDSGGTSRADHAAEARAYAEIAWRWHLSQPWGAGTGVTDALTLRARIRRVHEIGHRRIPYDVRSSSKAARVGTKTAWKSDRRHLDAGRFNLLFAGHSGGRRAGVALLTDPRSWGGRCTLDGTREGNTTQARVTVVFPPSPGSWLPSDADLFHRGTGGFRGLPPFCGLVLDLIALGCCASTHELAEWTGADEQTVIEAVERLLGERPVGGRFRPRLSRSGVVLRRREDEPRPLPCALVEVIGGTLRVALDGIREALRLDHDLAPTEILQAGIAACERFLRVDGAQLRRQARIEAERSEHRAKCEQQAALAGVNLEALDSIRPRPPQRVEPPVPLVVEAVREVVERFRGAATEGDVADALGAPHGDVIRALLHLQERGEVAAAISEKVVRGHDGRPLPVVGPLVWSVVKAEQRVEDADRALVDDLVVGVGRAAGVPSPGRSELPSFGELATRAHLDGALARLRARARAGPGDERGAAARGEIASRRADEVDDRRVT